MTQLQLYLLKLYLIKNNLINLSILSQPKYLKSSNFYSFINLKILKMGTEGYM